MKAAMTNFRSPSFDPKNGLFIVSARESYSLYFAKPADGVFPITRSIFTKIPMTLRSS
jgi:hypothetical protein